MCDPRRAATFLHLTDDRYRFEFRLRDDERATDLSPTALLRPWTSTPPTVIRCAEYTFRARVVDRWRTERTFLLGDAAHLMPPFIGQGLGAGLRDAHNLAWKLAAVLAGRANEELLGSYPRERDPHVRATIRTALLVGRAMTGGGGPAALVRRPLAAALLRLPGAEKRALAAVATRFPPGPAVERHSRHDLAGTLCPQPRLAGSVLLDEAVGPGWGLLHAGPVDARTAAAARATDARTIDVSGTPLHAWLQSGRTTAAAASRPRGGPHRTAPPGLLTAAGCADWLRDNISAELAGFDEHTVDLRLPRPLHDDRPRAAHTAWRCAARGVRGEPHGSRRRALPTGAGSAGSTRRPATTSTTPAGPLRHRARESPNRLGEWTRSVCCPERSTRPAISSTTSMPTCWTGRPRAASGTSRLLADHVVNDAHQFLLMAQGKQPDWSAPAPHLTQAWGPTFRATADNLIRAWHDLGDTPPLPPALQFAEFAVHDWDLATALGLRPDALDPQVAELGLQFMRTNLTPELREARSVRTAGTAGRRSLRPDRGIRRPAHHPVDANGTGATHGRNLRVSGWRGGSTPRAFRAAARPV